MSFESHVLSQCSVTQGQKMDNASTQAKTHNQARKQRIARTYRVRVIAALALVALVSMPALAGEPRSFPGDGSVHQNPAGVRLLWQGGQGRVAVLAGPDSSALQLMAEVDNDSTWVLRGIPAGTTWYWRLIVHGGTAEAETTSAWRFNVSGIALTVSRFVASADAGLYDDETSSRYDTLAKNVDLSHAAFVVMDLWESDLPVALTVVRMIGIARRHGIPVFFCTHEGVLHHAVQVEPWETSQDEPIDSLLKARGITTLFYLGFDSGTCLTVSRPNSIVPLTKRNPGLFDIILIKDCTWSQSYPLHFWNVQSIESRWQSTTFRALADAFGETEQPEQWEYFVYDWPYPIDSTFGTTLKPSETAVLVVNVWELHENNGWSERIRRLADQKIAPLLNIARYKGYKVIHVLDGRPPMPSCAPMGSEPVLGTQDSVWMYLYARNVKSLIVVGNFHSDSSSVFPLEDGWGLGFAGGGSIRNGFWGRTIFLEDCISVFETPASLATEELKHAFLRRQTTAPGVWDMGTVHGVSALDIFHRNTNTPPAFRDTTMPPSTDDRAFACVVRAVDPETIPFGDSIRYELLQAPAWLTMDSLTGALSGNAPIAPSATAQVRIAVRDNLGASTIRNFSLRFDHVNHAPTIVAVEPLIVREDSTIAVAVRGSDPDSVLGQPLRYALSPRPGWLTLDPVSGRLSGTPGLADVGNVPMTLTVSDDSGATASMPVTLNVLHRNHPPVFRPVQTLPVQEDHPFSIAVSVVDPDSALFHDRPRYALAPASSWLAIDEATGVVSGTPDIRHLADSVFQVIAVDDSGASAMLTLRIPVLHVNHPPQFAAVPAVSAAEDTLYRVYAGASDRDTVLGDRIQYRMVVGPGWLKLDTMTCIASGIPGPEDVGSGTMTLIARDDSGATGRIEVPYTVRHTNHAPSVTMRPAFSAVEDSAYVSLVAAEDADAPRFGDSLRFTAVLMPGWLSLDPKTGTLTGIPRAGQLADTTLAVAITDGRGGSTSMSMGLSVRHTNHPPAFLPFPSKDGRAVEDQPFVMSCEATDSDAPYHGDHLMYALSVRPAWLGIDPQTGMLSGTPLEGDHDTTFTVVVSDGAASASITVVLPVQPVNDPPQLAGRLNITLTEDSSATLELFPLVHDPDNERIAMHFEIASMVPGADCHYRGAPPEGSLMVPEDTEDSLLIILDTTSANVYVRARRNFTGMALPFILTVRDPEGLGAAETLSVNVTPVNDPPVLAAFPAITVAEDDSVLLTAAQLGPLVTDPDDPDSALTWFARPTSGLLPQCTPRGLRVLPARDWFGTDTLTVIVQDRAGLQDSVRVAVNVRPVNDPPVLAHVPALKARGDSVLVVRIADLASDVDDPVASLRASADLSRVPAEVDSSECANMAGKAGPEGSVHLSIDSTMTLRISFTGDFHCTGLPVMVRVSDPRGGEFTDTLYLFITPPVQPLVLQAVNDTVGVPGMPFVAHVRARQRDDDAEPLSFSLSGPSWLHIDSSGRISGTPVKASDDTVRVIALSHTGAADTLMFRIVVRGETAPDVPADYVLYQNYPNPFNPSTTIRFGLPEASRVSAEVFNILGQRVATIVAAEMQAGYHAMQWAPVNLASGAYIVVLNAHGLVSAARDARLIRKVSLVR
jgi:hypothetical protein